MPTPGTSAALPGSSGSELASSPHPPFGFPGDDTNSNTLYLARKAATLASQYDVYVARKLAASGGFAFASGTIGNVWDGAKHKGRLTWVNYFTRDVNGNLVQSMFFQLAIDGQQKWLSANMSSATVSLWAKLDHLWLAKGYGFATILNVKTGFPLDAGGITAGVYAPLYIPAGALPYTLGY